MVGGPDAVWTRPALQRDVERIFASADPFCAEHLDLGYGRLVCRLVAKWARKRPSPLVRGDPRVWAAAAVHAIGNVSFLLDEVVLAAEDEAARRKRRARKSDARTQR